MPVLCLIVFIDLLGFGIVAPLFPLAAEHAGASPFWVTFGGSGVYALLQLLSTPVWGRLSDRRGRKLVLALSMFGSGLAYLLLALARDPVGMILARALAGAMAGNIAAAYAYATDVSTPEERAKALGQLAAAFGLGFAFGPAIGGLLGAPAGHVPSLLRPGLVAAALSFAAGLGAVLVLKETVPQARPGAGAPARENLFKGRPALLRLVIGMLVVQGVAALFQSVLPLFAVHRLHLDTRGIGVIFFVLGGLAVIGQGGLAGRLSKVAGPRTLVIAGLAVFGLGLAALSLTSGIALLAVGLVLLGVGQGIFSPAASTLFSLQAAPHERGRVMASYNAAGSAGRIVGPMISGPLFAHAAGLPFAIGAGAVLLLGLPMLASGAPRPSPVGGPSTSSANLR